MSMDKESRSALLGPMPATRSVGSRLLRGRWQWPPTVAFGEPCQTVLRGLRSAVGIASRGKDGVVDGLPVARSTTEERRSGKGRKDVEE